MCGTRRRARSVVCDLVAGLLRTWKTSTPPRSPEPTAGRRGDGTAPVLRSGELQLRLHHAIEDILFKQGSGEPWAHMLEYHPERETLPNADLDDGSPVYS
jgi:monooxygenase